MPTTASSARRRLTALAALAGVVAIVAAACSSSGSTPAPVPLPPSAAASGATACTPESGTFQMGIEPWIGYGPWWIADKKAIRGQRRRRRRSPTSTPTRTSTPRSSAGQINGANIATHTALRLASEGTPITIVLLLDQSNAADAILAGADITRVADLAGKQVAYEEGTTSDILLRYALGRRTA